jgi:glycosyltransferase involved in cell wall biosynthesis
MTRARICFVVASPLTVKAFLSDQIAALAREHAVTVVSNLESGEQLESISGTARVLSVPIERRIAPLRDLAALVRLTLLFRRSRFAAVQSVTPKAGLLAMLAGFLSRVPVRVHVFTGQVWVTRRGVTRWFLKLMDRVIASCATHVLADSPSQREFLLAQGVVSAQKSRVLGKGSICGVDTGRFRPDRQARSRVRNALGIDDTTVVFLYLGRLNADKGLLDLARAYAAPGLRDTALLVVGPDEERIRPKMHEICRGARLIFLDYTPAPQDYMAAADVLCLPSYREGFGAAIIEAAACGVPAIGSRIYGIIDAIVEGETGLLHTLADASDLAGKMEMLMKDPMLRQRLGARARQRAVNEFNQQRITQALLDYYRGALGE